jgi:hypothetical protein
MDEAAMSADRVWGILEITTICDPYQEKIMNLRNTLMTGLGLSTLLLGYPSAQAQTKLQVPQQQPPKGMSKLSSSLGGPVTPTKPYFFEDSSATSTLPSLSLDNDDADRQIRRSNADGPVVPMVGDPPRGSRGGIINIKTD